jgi:hypothetical protein
MQLHLDGSSHAWFQDDRRHDLLVFLDDATSEIYYAQLVEEESTRHGDDRSARGDRAKRGFLRALERSYQSFFPFPESQSVGGSHPADASGASLIRLQHCREKIRSLQENRKGH